MEKIYVSRANIEGSVEKVATAIVTDPTFKNRVIPVWNCETSIAPKNLQFARADGNPRGVTIEKIMAKFQITFEETLGLSPSDYSAFLDERISTFQKDLLKDARPACAQCVNFNCKTYTETAKNAKGRSIDVDLAFRLSCRATVKGENLTCPDGFIPAEGKWHTESYYVCPDRPAGSATSQLKDIASECLAAMEIIPSMNVVSLSPYISCDIPGPIGRKIDPNYINPDEAEKMTKIGFEFCQTSVGCKPVSTHDKDCW